MAWDSKHWKLHNGFVVYQPIEEREGVDVGTYRWDDVEGYLFMPNQFELTIRDLIQIARILNGETVRKRA